MMNKNIPLVLALALVPLASFAGTDEWKNGQFEVNALYGRADSRLYDTNFYGATVAGGYYFGPHLFQFETGALISEGMQGGTAIGPNPINTAQTLVQTFTKLEQQDVPIWFNYRYGFTFGPKDCIRLEAGPVIGGRIETLRTKYNLAVIQSGQPTQYTNGSSQQNGGLVFDYGLAVGLRVRLGEHWGVNAGYRYVRSTRGQADAKIDELATSTKYVYNPLGIPEHGTHYASLGVEYRF